MAKTKGDYIIPKPQATAQQLTSVFNLQNVQTIVVSKAPYPVFAYKRPKTDNNNPYDGQIVYDDNYDKELYQSKLGTPVLTNLVIEAGEYTDDRGNRKTFPKLTFDTILLTVAQSKNIQKTVMQGRPGTVKEYISLGDFEVTINGIICGSNGVYPRDDVANLKDMLNSPLSLKVTSWWLQIWDVDEIVVETFEVPQIAGEYSQQQFSINALSDYPVELEVLNA